jgi:hypothetical protein
MEIILLSLMILFVISLVTNFVLIDSLYHYKKLFKRANAILESKGWKL